MRRILKTDPFKLYHSVTQSISQSYTEIRFHISNFRFLISDLTLIPLMKPNFVCTK